MRPVRTVPSSQTAQPTCSRQEGLCRWRCFYKAATNIHQFLVGSISPPIRTDTHSHSSATEKLQTLLDKKREILTHLHLVLKVFKLKKGTNCKVTSWMGCISNKKLLIRLLCNRYYIPLISWARKRRWNS